MRIRRMFRLLVWMLPAPLVLRMVVADYTYTGSSPGLPADVMTTTTTTTCQEDDLGSCRTRGSAPQVFDGHNPEKAYTMTCEDDMDHCPFWAQAGECESNAHYMLVSCAESCETCENTGSGKKHRFSDLGVKQVLSDSMGKNTDEELEAVLIQAQDYIRRLKRTKKKSFWVQCKHIFPDCAIWAARGQCESNPDFMKSFCAPACQSCEQSRHNKCKIDKTTPLALESGEINTLFGRLTTQDFGYSVTTHSSPTLNGGPWIISLDGFIDKEEAATLVNLAVQNGFVASREVVAVDLSGSLVTKETDAIDASYSPCKENCNDHAVVQEIMERLSTMLDIHEKHVDYFKFMQFDQGQYDKSRYDHHSRFVDLPQGPRAITALLYLSKVYGGETNFTKVDVSIPTRLGRLILFPNVLDDNPLESDNRTFYESAEVTKGTAYSLLTWYHQRDLQAARDNECAQ